MDLEQNSDLWKSRAPGFNKLFWATDKDYLAFIINISKITPAMNVLDIGCGTGILTRALSKYCRKIFGIDNSQDMLDLTNDIDNISYINMDARYLHSSSFQFDRVFARQVFQHIHPNTYKAFNECYRVLVPGGSFVLSQGVPVNYDIINEYRDIFNIKDNRIIYTSDDLIYQMERAGFSDINDHPYYFHNFSVNNWLSNSGLSERKRSEIYSKHINASDYFKFFYEMKITSKDCFITVKFSNIIGVKPK